MLRLTSIKQTPITLVIIAKDEAHVITRCFDSCKGLIDAVVLVDTGSTDDTVKVAEQWASDNNITLFKSLFMWTGDFSAARNYALRYARNHRLEGWYLLLDADEELVADPEVIRKAMSTVQDKAITIPLLMDGCITPRVNLIKYGERWSYKYEIHETLTLEGQPFQTSMLCNPVEPEKGPHVITKQDGARSQQPKKLQYDLEALRSAYKRNPDPHYIYHAGRTLAAMNDWGASAMEFQRYFFLVKNKMDEPGVRGKIQNAKLLVARGAALCGEPEAKVTLKYLAAYEADPTRAEPLGELADYHAMNGNWALCHAFASAAMNTPHGNNYLNAAPEWRTTWAPALLAKAREGMAV